MKRADGKTEKGQTIVIVALMMLAILAVLALTLDGGLTYVQRRRAQNAADAAALAGARLMCTSEDPVTNEQVIAEARNYAARNGIDDVTTNVQVAPIQNGSVSSVTVTANIPFDTFFTGVLGIADTEVGAVAEAACYPPCAGTGVLPIAWSCTPPAGEPSDSDYCLIDYADDANCSLANGDPMYIIVDSDDFDESIICQDPPPAPGDNPSSGMVDCDLDDDGANEVILLSGADRSWLNLNGDSANADELKQWLQFGFNEFPLTEHMWFNGTTGVISAAYGEIRTYLQDKTVFIPVFDTYCPDLPGPTNSSCTWHAQDVVKDTSATSKDYFHIYTFAMFHVTCVDSAPVKCPVNQALELPPQYKTVEGCFLKGITDNGSGAPGQCNASAGAFVLKLVR